MRSYGNASSNSCCQCVSGAKAWPDDGLARGVELQQLLGHVAHRLLDARLGPLPGRPAKPSSVRMARAGVLLDQVQPLDGDEELVVAGVAELHELLVLADVQTDLLQSDERADAVIDVDDEIADLQIAQVREERARLRPPPLRARGVPLRRRRSRHRRRAGLRAAGSRATGCRVRRAAPPRARLRSRPSGSGQQGRSPAPSR